MKYEEIAKGYEYEKFSYLKKRGISIPENTSYVIDESKYISSEEKMRKRNKYI